MKNPRNPEAILNQALNESWQPKPDNVLRLPQNNPPAIHCVENNPKPSLSPQKRLKDDMERFVDDLSPEDKIEFLAMEN